MVSWSKETCEVAPITRHGAAVRRSAMRTKFDGTECDASDELILLNGVIEIRNLEIAKFSEL